MITIENLEKTVEDFELGKINLEIENGEYFVILGPTGSGKTLFLELLAGFLEPDKGSVWINDEDVTNVDVREREVAFVHQDYSLFPHMTVWENVSFGPRVNGFSEDLVKEKTSEVLTLLGIQGLADRKPDTLSGGEMQKTSLARSLVMEPELLLLDEPISALDVPSQEMMREELKKIHRERDVTVIHVTHDREEASWLGNRIGVMQEGSIIQIGSPREVFHEPRTEFVADFMGSENIFEGRASLSDGISKIKVNDEIEVQTVSDNEGQVTFCIRPEEILLSKDSIKSSGRNTFEGKITDVKDLENTSRISVDVGLEFVVLVTKRSRNEMDLSDGDTVYLTFKASAVHVI